MGRKPKKGLEYSPWNTDIFEDIKINKLLLACGWVGFSVYFYICQKAYQTNGYFIEWTEDSMVLTSMRMGQGINTGIVEEVVSKCLEVELFDQQVYIKQQILTSRAMQKSYVNVLSRRRDKTVIGDIWLLDSSESAGIEFEDCEIVKKYKCNNNVDLQHNNSYLQHTNADLQHNNALKTTKSTQSKSKSKSKSISMCVQSNIKAGQKNEHTQKEPTTIQEIEEYCKSKGYVYTAPVEFYNYNASKGWTVGNSKMTNWKYFVDRWEQQERKSRNQNNKFNSFEQRERTSNDFNELEKKLLNGNEGRNEES